MHLLARKPGVAAALGIVSLVAAILLAVPLRSSAATVAVWSVNFNDSTTGSWSQSGGDGATLSYVADPDNASNTVLRVARTADYVGIQSPTDALEAGVTYQFSMKVRLEDPAAGSADVRFVLKPAYNWIANTSGVSGSGWTTVSGSFAVPVGADPATLQAYIGTSAASVAGENYAYLVDDISVTTEVADTVVTAADFNAASIAPWQQSGGDGSTLSFVQDPDNASNTVLQVARTADYVGIQSPSGVFEAGKTYNFSMRARLVDPAAGTVDMRFVMKPAYNWIANTSGISGSAWTTVTGAFTVPADATPSTLQAYVGTSAASLAGETYAYLIDDVLVTTQGGGNQDPDPDPDPNPEPGTVAFSTDFEDGLDGWGPRDNGTGAPTVAITTSDARGGSQAALVSNRTSQGSGIGFDVTEVLSAGATYEVNAWLKFAQTPTEDIWLTLQNESAGSTSYQTLAQFTGMSSGQWVEVTARFTMPQASDFAYLYFETAYDGGATGNTSSFMVDDITVSVPAPVVIQDLTPIKDTLDVPFGIAIDSRETAGASAELLLKHADQITPENYMKPEAWYNAAGEWSPNAAEIDSLMDFAAENDLNLYGHVLVWHSQTPAWFFQHEDGTPLTTSEADKQILRDRLREHIFNVAQYLHDGWGDFGSDTNPLVAWDVVNEVIDDSSAYSDGMRRSEWYRILGEEFVDLSFIYADEAFNDTYAAPSAVHPVTLFINDYNTEQAGKRARYIALIERLIARDVPIDGVGHQFHVSLAMPVSNLDAAMADVAELGLLQVVTEFDVTTGTPESQAKFIEQGYYYRDAFNIFRSYGDDVFSITVWGLIDSRSWRDANGGPLVFDDAFRAKPAYYGIVEGAGTEEPLPSRQRTANVFAEAIPATEVGLNSASWERLPLHTVDSAAQFQLRWDPQGLTAYVNVNDASADASDGVEFTVGATTYEVARDGSGDVAATAVATATGYEVIARLPVANLAQGQTLGFDLAVVDASGPDTSWNSPGVLGTLTLVEPVSFAEVPHASAAPAIDGVREATWDEATTVVSSKQVSGTSGSQGEFELLWKDNMLYIYATVEDEAVDVSGSDPWIQDSVEIYVDASNVKNGSYRYDDTQIRINAFNTVSFGTGDEAFQANRVDSATAIVDGGYVVEVAINLLDSSGLGTFHGLDVQVNDAANGARTSITNWADPTGAGYQSTARWGVIKLVEGASVVEPWQPLADDQLTSANQGCVNVPATVTPGQDIAVAVCGEREGQQVSVYMYSEPVLIGSGVVSAAGIVSAKVPANAALGAHKIAVYSATGELIGWTPVTVAVRSGDGLAFTGVELGLLIAAGAILLGSGLALVMVRRRASAA